MALRRPTARTGAILAMVLLATVFLAIAVGCGSTATGPTAKTDQGASIMDKLYAQVRADFDAIKAGDATEIYEDTAASLRASKSGQDFAASVSVNPAYTSWTKFTIESDKTHTLGQQKPGTEGAVVALTIDLSSGSAPPYKLDAQYVFEKGSWRLASLMPSAGMQQN
jgi:hypothetical protein